MTEGELYRKIREMCPPAEGIFLNEPNETIFTLETVEKVLDEVKKEIFETFDKSRVEHYHALKKWFGSEEK